MGAGKGVLGGLPVVEGYNHGVFLSSHNTLRKIYARLLGDGQRRVSP